MKVAQSCLTLCHPKNYTVHGILQARILEWAAFPFSRGSSWPRNWTSVSCTAGGFFTKWAKGRGRGKAIVWQMTGGMSSHRNDLHWPFSLVIVHSVQQCAALCCALDPLDPKHLKHGGPWVPRNQRQDWQSAQRPSVHWLNKWASEWIHPFFDNFEESSDEWLKSDHKSSRRNSVLYPFLHFLHL